MKLLNIFKEWQEEKEDEEEKNDEEKEKEQEGEEDDNDDPKDLRDGQKRLRRIHRDHCVQAPTLFICVVTIYKWCKWDDPHIATHLPRIAKTVFRAETLSDPQGNKINNYDKPKYVRNLWKHIQSRVPMTYRLLTACVVARNVDMCTEILRTYGGSLDSGGFYYYFNPAFDMTDVYKEFVERGDLSGFT